MLFYCCLVYISLIDAWRIVTAMCATYNSVWHYSCRHTHSKRVCSRCTVLYVWCGCVDVVVAFNEKRRRRRSMNRMICAHINAPQIQAHQAETQEDTQYIDMRQTVQNIENIQLNAVVITRKSNIQIIRANEKHFF